MNGGWPKTIARQWCKSGWIEREKQSFFENAHSQTGAVGFNFAYIKGYPEDACEWLIHARETLKAVPDSFRHIVDEPMSGAISALMPLGDFYSDKDSCEEIFHWGSKCPGFDNKAPNDGYMSILAYLDAPEDREKNEAIRASLGADHPWVVLCELAIVD